VAYMGDKRNACRVLMGKAGRKGPLWRPNTDGIVILKWMLDKWKWCGLD
jgi:hypothetical protein